MGEGSAILAAYRCGPPVRLQTICTTKNLKPQRCASRVSLRCSKEKRLAIEK